MASKTTNYGLNKHSPQDFYNVEARNENWDKIDEALAATDPTKITTKAAPADGDGVMIADSADGGKAKRLLWSNVKAALGKLFVPLARKINGKTLAKDVTLTGENIAVSTADPTPISGAVKYRTNPNLLDNWFFGRPVNQRGQVEWVSSASAYVPCVDRWNWFGQYVAGSTLKLLDDGLQLIGEPNVAGLYQHISQKIEKDRLPIGAAVTLSALVKSESDASIILCIDDKNYTTVAVKANVWELITYTLNAPSVEQTYNISIQWNTAGTTFTVKAAKLELGSTQTLAHKENGVWVLNEIPDFGEQLRRCQRYCRPIPHKLDICVVGETYYAYTEESFEEMRVAPVSLTNLVGKNVKNITDNDAATIINVFTWNKYGGVAIQLSQNPNTDIVFLDSMNYLISADL